MMALILLLGLFFVLPTAISMGAATGPWVFGRVRPPVVDQGGLHWEGRALGPRVTGGLVFAGIGAGGILGLLGALSVVFGWGEFIAVIGGIICAVAAGFVLLAMGAAWGGSRRWMVDADAFEVRVTLPKGTERVLPLKGLGFELEHMPAVLSLIVRGGEDVRVPIQGSAASDGQTARSWLQAAALTAAKPPPAQPQAPPELQALRQAQSSSAKIPQ